MPIEVAMWRLGETPEPVTFVPMALEAKLEEMLAQDISVLSPDLMLVGRQVRTSYGKLIDLLAIDREGNLSVIELKRDKTPRDAVAQLLDYGSWAMELAYADVAAIYAEQSPGRSLEEGFAETFGTDASPEELNRSQQLILVASQLDASSERIIKYLAESFGVPVNAVFFRYFRDEDREYLARTWFVDPAEAEVAAADRSKKREPWDGQSFYVNVGDGLHRTWVDCMRYGFVCGGGGTFYSKTLKQLFPGAIVFVNLPGTGYVGVGEVTEPAVSVKEFTVLVNGKETPILDAPLEATQLEEHARNPEGYEYFVRVTWLKAVPAEEAYRTKGMFGNQNTVCKLRNRFTLDRLREHFGVE